jgi:hypothetical protein
MTTPPANPAASPKLSAKSATRMHELSWWQWALLIMPLLVTVALVMRTIRHFNLNEQYFTYSAYYVLYAMVATYAAVLITGKGTQLSLRQWFVENRFGIALTVAIASVVLYSVAPGYRVLADEANLIGVSKNLFYQKTANFATTGKWYFENYWNLNQTIDRRPALFPFLVSLLHTLRGYHPENAFHLNAIILSLFVFSAYRLGKLLSGELFGIVAAILAAAEANTLLAARSAGFDLLSSFMILIVIKSFVEYTIESSPKRLALLSLNLCVLAHVRYEGWALLVAAVGVLLVFRLVRPNQIRPYAVMYSFLPVFLAPRYWQAVAKAKDAEQPMSAALFSVSNFIENTRDYVKLILKPFDTTTIHSPWLIILAAGGIGLFVSGVVRHPKDWKFSTNNLRRLAFVVAVLGLEATIAFSYSWGKSLHPASARLFIWFDTCVAFCAAWLLVAISRRVTAWVPLLGRNSGGPAVVLASLVLFATQIPTASEGRFTNALILTRQASRTWDYFSKLGNKNILIMTDRPGLYTIMDYGALDISTAHTNRDPLYELSRKLYSDVYLIQEVELSTGKPKAEFDVWSDAPQETVYEFQNTDSSSVRIARMKH